MPPLSALLSYALCAFTIEFDNEAERQLQHRTTNYGGNGPWLVSAVMWWNCMRFVDADGISIGEIIRRARTKTNFHGMMRWGYVSIEGPHNKASSIVRATAHGLQAQEIWAPISRVIENRWRERFGVEKVDRLGRDLVRLVGQFEYELPDCMPILGYGLVPDLGKPSRRGTAEAAGGLPLEALLAKALLAFTLEFERESKVSLAICADVLRLVPEVGIALKNLPRSAGVSKESISMALTYLKNQCLASIERNGHLGLTDTGVRAKTSFEGLLGELEGRWQTRFGNQFIAGLKETLFEMTGDGSAEGSPLFEGLVPGPLNWRAKVPMPACLPDFPMVLHRGGYPDGS